MKENHVASRAIRLILFAALAGGLFALFQSTRSPLAKAGAMAFAVLSAESFLTLVLSFLTPAPTACAPC
jgi:hypothetical protein